MSKVSPKVSIIVPIYNVEKYLQECLESLVTQTLRDIEIICVNDGSTDSSLEIIKSYAAKDNRIKIIDKPNAGYGHSCNTGFDAAAADYVGIIESDDFADVNMFADLYELITKNDVDAVKSEWYDYTGKHKKAVKGTKITSQFNTGKISSVEDKAKLIKGQPSVWSYLYKKSFLNENNIRFLETPGASFQDTSFDFKVITLAKEIYITENAYVYYRNDNAGSSVNIKGNGEFIFKEFAEIDRFLNEHPDLKTAYNVHKFQKQYKTYYWLLRRVAPKYRQEVFEKFVKEFQNYHNNGELDEPKGLQLVNNPQKAWKKFQWKLVETRFKDFKRNLISVRISSKRTRIELFGRQVVRIG